MADYTTIDDVDLARVSTDYGLHNPSIRVLPGGAANSSFTVGTDTDTYVLTVLDNHDPVTAHRLVQVTTALFEHGLPTAEIVPARDGRTVTEANARPAVLKRWIEGTVHDSLPVPLLGDAGATLASLHRAPVDLPSLPRHTRRLSEQQEAEISRFTDHEFADWLRTRLDRLRGDHGTRPDTITHGDLFADNLIERPDHTLAVIDWETASLDDPLLDLGMAVVGLARLDDHIDIERTERLVEGYHAVLPLTEDDRAILPRLAEYAALVIAFHRYYRHNVRFPNPARAQSHRPMMRLVDNMRAIRV
ncbi:phosphotransferase [Nocardia jiangsuensis]|uniref:Phosphotransferase n=1 Tax=Nocardia jiangsuensis TaxID=1691563 RepID=A0ABV8E0D0_9NOCA